MNDFLKRFIEHSLFAATTLLLLKVLGVWGGLLFTRTDFALESAAQIFTYIMVQSAQQATLITTIADTFFVVTLVLVGIFVLLKTTYFNDLTRHPRVLVKVIHYNLTGWLEDGQGMYPKLFAWGTFFWLATVLVIRDYMTIGIPLALPIGMGAFAVLYTYQVFRFLDSHISDMISYLYGTKRKVS